MKKKNLVASIIGFYHNPQCEVLVNDVHSIIDMPNIMEGLPAITVKINGNRLWTYYLIQVLW